MDYSRMARKLRDKIGGFSGELSHGLPKTAERFVREMIYGVQASQSVVLTKIGRTLEEPMLKIAADHYPVSQVLSPGRNDSNGAF